MPRIIKRSEITEEDVFKNVRDSADQTIKRIDAMNKSAKVLATTLGKDIDASKATDVKGLDKFNKATAEASKLQKTAITLDDQRTKAINDKAKAEINLQRIRREKLKTDREAIRNTQLITKEKERQKTAHIKAAKAVREEGNEYKKLVVKTRDLKNESKRLGAEMIKLEQGGRRNTKEYRALAREYKNVTNAARTGDTQLKKLDGTVGDNFRNVGNYGKALKGVKTAFIGLAGAFGAFQLIKGAGKIIVDFDQAQGDLLAISGKNEEQLKGLTAQAKELGATTQFTATQITEMQIELAKLGFTTGQIEASTKAVSNFAAATGADIPAAAALAGSALRGFGLDASEMERVTSVLGVATTKSALNFQSLETGLSTIAPVANAFGFSIEDTTALMAQLANAGFDASSSATATRNILLNLADANGDLAKQLGRPIKSADDLAAGLAELEAKGVNLGEALELTDKRSVAAFETFLKGADKLVPLRDSITDVNDELEAMAAKRLDTIGGQFTLLTSAWEGFILSVNEGTGAGENIKKFLGFLAENLGAIVSIIGKAIFAWAAYKTTILAVKAANFLLSGGIQETIKGMVASVKGLKNMGKAAEASGKAVKKSGEAMKAVPWILIIGLAVELATKMWDIASGAQQARIQTELYRKAEERAANTVEKLNEETQKRLKEDFKRVDVLRARGIIDDAKASEMRRDFVEDEIRNNGRLISKLEEKRKESSLETKTIKEQIEVNKELQRTSSIKEGAGLDALEQGKKLQTQLMESNALTRLRRKEIEGLKIQQEALNDQVDGYNNDLFSEGVNLKSLRDEKNKNAKADKKINTEFKTQIDLLKELNANLKENLKIQQDLAELDRTSQIAETQELIDKETELQKTRVTEGGEFDFTTIMALTEQRKQLEITAIEEVRDFEIQALQDSFTIKINEQKTALKKERDDLIAGAKGNADALQLIEFNYQTELRKIKGLELDGQELVENEKILIKAEANAEILALEKDTQNELKAINEELVTDAETYANAIQEADAATVDSAKDAAKNRMAWAQLVTDFLKKQADDRIAALDREISAAQKQQERFEKLADEGNIKAEQSIAQQQDLENKAVKEKLALQKQIARIELRNTAIQTYGQKVEEGSETPFADTVKEIALLQAFISALPAFYGGTDTTVGAALGAPMMGGRDGHVVRVDKTEKILNPMLSKMTGNHTTGEIAKITQDYDRGKLIKAGDQAVQIGSGWDTPQILQSLSELNKSVKNIPDNSLGIENAVRGAFDLVKTSKKGNNLIYNRYRIKN